MNLKGVRAVCKDRLAVRKTQDVDSRETLSTCTACEGSGLFSLSAAPKHHAVCCPFCDGFGANDSFMKSMYARYMKAKALP